MKVNELLAVIVELLEEKKANDISVIPVADKTTLADYFVLASANTVNHVRALERDITLTLKEDYGLSPFGVEGVESSRWILIDYATVVVNIMHKTERDYYALDKFWNSKEEPDTIINEGYVVENAD